MVAFPRGLGDFFAVWSNFGNQSGGVRDMWNRMVDCGVDVWVFVVGCGCCILPDADIWVCYWDTDGICILGNGVAVPVASS